ncbi:MAG: ABC transporter permease [Limisphaerales bacterium]
MSFRFAIRQLAKSPGFTVIAVVVLALGIGANTIIFSIINSILIKPIQVPHPERLVGIYQHDRDHPDSFRQFSYPDFADLRSAKDAAFSDLFAFCFASVGLQGSLTERTPAEFVSANYFSALGVPPAMGRAFLPEEESSGTPVAVLTHSFWTRLGADPSIVGRKIKLTRGEVTVVGVMPRGFTGAQLRAPAMFFPIGMAPTLNPNPGQMASRILTDRGDGSFMVMGRLKPGLTLSNAGAALASLTQQFSIPDPSDPKARTLICAPPSRFNFSAQPSHVPNGLAEIAGFASGLSVMVLVIACLNLANMLLARGAGRRKEIAIRLALGAGRSRILSQLLTEGVVLAVLGGAAGLLVSAWGTTFLTAFIYSGVGMPPDFPKFDLAPDSRVLVALLMVSGVATLFFALGPVWNLARLDLNRDLKRHAGDDSRERLRGRLGARELLAVGQMACALALLVAAALFSRSAMNVARANPGFEFGSNFYLTLDPTLAGYSGPRVRQLIHASIERLSSLPGVESVSSATSIPFGDSSDIRGVQLGGAPPPSNTAATLADGKELFGIYTVIGADYFHTLGIPLQRGREFERREAEVDQGPPVVIISRNLADQLWPDEDPIGRSLQFPGPGRNASATVMTVVGVVPPIQWRLFDKRPSSEIYVPSGQDFQASLHLHVRVAPGADPAKLMAAAREEMRRLDPGLPVTEIKTLADLHRDSPTVRVVRMGAMLFGAFGGLALFLSLLGIYGLKAYAVARRTREIGIRMALGASARDVVAMILRESAVLAGLGLGLGLVLALAVGKVGGGFLYQVPAADPVTFSVIPLLLLCTALVACILPARRAAKVDPMAALRHE